MKLASKPDWFLLHVMNPFHTALAATLAIAMGLFLLPFSNAIARESDETPYAAEYSLDMQHADERRFHVQAHFPDRSGSFTVVQLPVWSPGSYLVREYAKNLSHFEVLDNNGDPLEFEKITKDRWKITHEDGDDLTIRYRIYGGDLSVRTPYITSIRALWQATSVFVSIPGETMGDWTIQTFVPQGWQSMALAAPVEGQQQTWAGNGSDQFYDTVGLAGELVIWPIELGDVPHRLVFDSPGNYHRDSLLPIVEAGLKKTLELFEGEASELSGRSPALVEQYDILTAMSNDGGGGLEHLYGTLLLWERWSLESTWDRMAFTTLAVHEYFHLWNIKHIRPEHFYAYDYGAENYTRLLFEIEGITSYYDILLTGRGLGTLDDADKWVTEWLGFFEREIQTHEGYPGKDVQSLRESSYDAWIKYYRKDEDYVNTNVHYYRKGALVSALLDQTIREYTNDEKSLDHVMRYIWNQYLEQGKGYTEPEGILPAVEAATGYDATEFFTKYVTGIEPLPYKEVWLDRVGLELTDPDSTAWLGVNFSEQNGCIIMQTVLSGGPAEEAGLSNMDELVAIDGWRVIPEADSGDLHYTERIDALEPGQTVTLTIAREGKLMERELTVGIDASTRKLKPIEDPTEEQIANFRQWSGLPHPGTLTD